MYQIQLYKISLLEEKEFDLLNPTTVDEYKGFVDQFVTEKATLLYYAEEKALDNLKYSYNHSFYFVNYMSCTLKKDIHNKNFSA